MMLSMLFLCQVGAWHVVEQKLIPLLVDCQDDVELVVTLTKIFVMLTMPIAPAVKSWCHVKIDKKADPDIRRDMHSKKINAQAQVRRFGQLSSSCLRDCSKSSA